MTIADSLYAAILRDPADDLARLVYAEYIEEQGESERAEFIRCQIAHSSIPVHECDRIYPGCTVNMSGPYVSHNHKCRGYEPQQRYIELWDKYGEQWFGNHDLKMEVVRGWPARVAVSMARLMGGECERCGGTGELGSTGDYDQYIIECRNCQPPGLTYPVRGTGRTTALIDVLAKTWPIERVMVTDAVIHPSGGNGSFYVGGLGIFPKEYWRRLESHPSRAAAINALSQVCVDLARERAGLTAKQ